MSILAMMAQSSDSAMHGITAIALHVDHAVHTAAAGTLADHGSRGLLHLAADNAPAAPVKGPTNYAELVKQVGQEEHLGWLTNIGKYFIGIFQKGGEVFVGFVTGIIPTLVVLMTAFYALIGMVGEERMHGFARFAGRWAITRYSLLPLVAVFFLTNPMAYTFGTFLEEKHKPAFYDSAVSFVHPPLGLFPHVNPGEYFVWGGMLVALLELEKKGKVPEGYHITVAIFYLIVGFIVILLKGIVTERITAFMARRQGVEL